MSYMVLVSALAFLAFGVWIVVTGCPLHLVTFFAKAGLTLLVAILGVVILEELV